MNKVLFSVIAIPTIILGAYEWLRSPYEIHNFSCQTNVETKIDGARWEAQFPAALRLSLARPKLYWSNKQKKDFGLGEIMVWYFYTDARDAGQSSHNDFDLLAIDRFDNLFRGYIFASAKRAMGRESLGLVFNPVGNYFTYKKKPLFEGEATPQISIIGHCKEISGISMPSQ